VLRKRLVSPFVVLGTAGLFALASVVFLQGDLRDLLIYYFAPVGVPFVCFLADRLQYPGLPLLDVPVLILALLRAAFTIPLISGHSLFLTYALLTTRTWVASITAVVVLVQVVYLKVFAWHDVTIVGGATLGLAAAWLYRTAKRPSWAAIP
jgi:hypothetical protein